MFDLRHNNLRLIPSKSAMVELFNCGLMIEDCKDILEGGYEPRKRARGTIEKWMDFKGKTYNVVAVKSYSFFYREDVYLIIHVGKFTRKKLRRIKK